MSIFKKFKTGDVDGRTKLGKSINIPMLRGISSVSDKGGLLVLVIITAIVLDLISYLQMMIVFGWDSSFSLIYTYLTVNYLIFIPLIFICIWSLIPLIAVLSIFVFYEVFMILSILIIYGVAYLFK